MALIKDNFYYVVSEIQYLKQIGQLCFEVLRYDSKKIKDDNIHNFTTSTPYRWNLEAPKDKENIREFDKIFGADKLSVKGKNIINIIYEELKKRDKFFADAKDD